MGGYVNKTHSTKSPPIRTAEVFYICLTLLSWFQLEYFLPIKLMRVEVIEDLKFQGNPITLLVSFLIRNRHKCAPNVYDSIVGCCGVNVKVLGVFMRSADTF